MPSIVELSVHIVVRGSHIGLVGRSLYGVYCVEYGFNAVADEATLNSSLMGLR